MIVKTIFQFATYSLKNKKYKLEIEFIDEYTKLLLDKNYYVAPEEKGIKIKKIGTIEQGLDSINLIVPSIYTVELMDEYGFMKEFIEADGNYNTEYRDNKKALVRLLVKDINEFDYKELISGYIFEDNIEYNEQTKTIEISVTPEFDKLKRIGINDYSDPGDLSLYAAIKFIYGFIDKNIELEFKHNWSAKCHYYKDGYVDVKYTPVENLQFNFNDYYKRINADSLYDVLKQLAFDFFAKTGLLSSNKAVFKMLSNYDNSFIDIDERKIAESKFSINNDNIDFVSIKYGNSSGHDQTRYNTPKEKPAGAKTLQKTLGVEFLQFVSGEGPNKYLNFKGNFYYNYVDKKYYLWQIEDSLNFPGKKYILAELLSKLYYKYRNDSYNGKKYVFTVKGIDYNYSDTIRRKWELFSPVRLTKYPDENKTIIEAIKIGYNDTPATDKFTPVAFTDENKHLYVAVEVSNLKLVEYLKLHNGETETLIVSEKEPIRSRTSKYALRWDSMYNHPSDNIEQFRYCTGGREVSLTNEKWRDIKEYIIIQGVSEESVPPKKVFPNNEDPNYKYYIIDIFPATKEFEPGDQIEYMLDGNLELGKTYCWWVGARFNSFPAEGYRIGEEDFIPVGDKDA